MQDLAALATARPVLFVSVVTLFGLFVGSFLNVVIHRLPLMMERRWLLDSLACLSEEKPGHDETASATARDAIVDARRATLPDAPAIPAADAPPFNIAVPRSRCPHCKRPIRAIENVPLLSWFALRGQCAGCGKPIPGRYPLVELVAGLIAGAIAFKFGFSLATVGALALAFALIALAMIDYDTTMLPDSITLPFLWLGLAFNLFGVYTTLPNAVVGAIGGYGLLWLVYHAYRLATGKIGMGFGDFKLLALLGAWFGADMLPLIILLSALVGAVVGIALMRLKGMQRDKPIPFGPFLAGAGLVTLFFGDAIMTAYLGSWG